MKAGGETNSRDELTQDEPVYHSPMAVENGPGSGSAEALVSPASEPPPPWRKIGIDANQPIDPTTGRIRVQVADPDVIASTGTGWVRLNFILGPWDDPYDNALHDGRTWAETYGQIITGFCEKGLKIYGLIGVEAMPHGPQNRFREPAPRKGLEDKWIELYARQFATIAEMFHQDISIFESFNEPDDWHGAQRNWVHPSWFAVMLHQIYLAVRRRPKLDRVKIISGPLQGLEGNRNAAASYLKDTYRAGKARFGWGRKGIPFPFDGVGYHLYVKHAFTRDQGEQDRAIHRACRQYLGAVHGVIREEEGKSKPLYVSEVGWTSNLESWLIQQREQFQANCLRTGLKAVVTDPLVALGFWFCTHDFRVEGADQFFGLYRVGEPTPAARKPAFEAFKELCTPVLGPIDRKQQYTNQQVINALYYAAVDLGLPSRWSLAKKAGLCLGTLAANRHRIYDGLPIGQLPDLTRTERHAVQARLDEQGAGQTAALNGSPSLDIPGGDGHRPDAIPDLEINLDLALALQEETLDKLERTNELLALVLDHTEGAAFGTPGEPQLISRVRRLRPSSLDDRLSLD